MPSWVISLGNGLRLNYRVQKSEPERYEVLACSKNNAPNSDKCSKYEIITTRDNSSSLISVVKMVGPVSLL